MVQVEDGTRLRGDDRIFRRSLVDTDAVPTGSAIAAAGGIL